MNMRNFNNETEVIHRDPFECSQHTASIQNEPHFRFCSFSFLQVLSQQNCFDVCLLQKSGCITPLLFGVDALLVSRLFGPSLCLCVELYLHSSPFRLHFPITRPLFSFRLFSFPIPTPLLVIFFRHRLREFLLLLQVVSTY